MISQHKELIWRKAMNQINNDLIRKAYRYVCNMDRACIRLVAQLQFCRIFVWKEQRNYDFKKAKLLIRDCWWGAVNIQGCGHVVTQLEKHHSIIYCYGKVHDETLLLPGSRYVIASDGRKKNTLN